MTVIFRTFTCKLSFMMKGCCWAELLCHWCCLEKVKTDTSRAVNVVYLSAVWWCDSGKGGGEKSSRNDRLGRCRNSVRSMSIITRMLQLLQGNWAKVSTEGQALQHTPAFITQLCVHPSQSKQRGASSGILRYYSSTEGLITAASNHSTWEAVQTSWDYFFCLNLLDCCSKCLPFGLSSTQGTTKQSVGAVEEEICSLPENCSSCSLVWDSSPAHRSWGFRPINFCPY